MSWSGVSLEVQIGFGIIDDIKSLGGGLINVAFCHVKCLANKVVDYIAKYIIRHD